jgi:hypothetical protein
MNKIISILLSILGAMVGIVFFLIGKDSLFLCILCIAVQGISFGATVIFPKRFRLLAGQKTHPEQCTVFPGVFLPGGALLLRILWDFYYDTDVWIRFILLCLLCSAVISGVYLLRHRELWKNSAKIATLFALIALMIYGPVGQLNALADPTPENSVCAQVLSKDVHSSYRHGKDIHRYFFNISTFEVKDDTASSCIERIQVPMTFYYNVDTGDEITIHYHKGAFGFSFARFKCKES